LRVFLSNLSLGSLEEFVQKMYSTSTNVAIAKAIFYIILLLAVVAVCRSKHHMLFKLVLYKQAAITEDLGQASTLRKESYHRSSIKKLK
jgi:flagellar biosynthesis protein FlhB